MGVFLRQQAQKAVSVQCHQQGQTQDQFIARPAQHGPAPSLANAGVKRIVEIHSIYTRPTDLAANALKRVK